MCKHFRHFFSTRRLKRETKDIFRSPTDETHKAKACATVLGRCRIFIFHSSVKYQKLTATKVHCLLRLLRAFWGVEQIASKTTSDGPEQGRRTAQHNNFWREHRDEKAKLDLLPFRRLSFVRCKIHFTFLHVYKSLNEIYSNTKRIFISITSLFYVRNPIDWVLGTFGCEFWSDFWEFSWKYFISNISKVKSRTSFDFTWF